MLQIKNINGVMVAGFEGTTRFNAQISQQVKDDLNEILSNKGANVILDLSGIHFLDSSAFGALISVLKTSKSYSSTFKICNANDEVFELFHIMQLNIIFEIHKTQESCLASFKA